MNDLSLLGIPDLPDRAFQRDAAGRIKPQGGGKGGSKPKVPDYEAAARATAQGNLDLARYATQANRVNQSTPYGTMTWSNDRSFDQAGYDAALRAYQQSLAAAQSQQSQGGRWEYPSHGESTGYPEWVPYGSSGSALRGSSVSIAPPNPADFYSGGDNWSQSMQFSPEIQRLFNNVLRQMGQAPSMQALDINGLPEMGQVYDPNLATNNATELLMRRMNPELDRQQESLRAQLANQGIVQGSSAYNRELERFGQQRNDATNQASLAGIGLGMQQQGQTYNQQNANRQLAAALQNQQFGQQSYLRGLPLNEFNQLLSGSAGPQFPGYSQQATTGGPDFLGAAQAGYSGALGGYNAQQAQRAGMMSGLGSVGGALGTYMGGAGMLGSAVGGPLGGLLGGAAGSLLGGLFG